MHNAAAKLREARFFFQLLSRLETTREPLVGTIHALRDEYAFLLSGFLNACYSTTEHLEVVSGKAEVESFKRQNQRVYGPGLRNLTVHERHISPAPAHYLGRDSAGALRTTIQFEYWFSQDDPVPITALCAQHLQDLLLFAGRFNVHPEA